MRMIAGFATLCLAASLVGPATYGQGAVRARAASGVEAAETPYLGVSAQDITADRARTLKLKEERGVEVTNVEADSAADKAGLKTGDVVMELNGQKVEGWEHLKRLVRETPIHREVKIGIWRNGAVQTLTAAMGARREMQMDFGNGNMVVPMPPTQPMTAMPPMPPMPQLDIPQFRTLMGASSLGIMGEALGQESQLAEFFGVKEGVLVRSVTKGSAAEKAGIKAGDVITKIDDTAISSPQQISSALRRARSQGTVNVTVVRNKKETTLGVTIETGGVYRGRLGTPDGSDGTWLVWQGGGERPSKILGQ
jgi:serine protease Do